MLLAVVLLVCWLGGITDLIAFVRQRGKLDDVLRDQALRRADAARVEAELRLSVLAAQVEPHFLFKTLASVRSAIVSDQARAAAIVDHLADYLRATIPQMRHEAASGSVPLGRQLDAAHAYLALMHERMPRLAFAVEAEPGLETAQVPPLMLISLVENAVKHGVEPKAGPARITVSARRVVDAGVTMLELEVRDDGVGFGSATSGAGVGLANIQERLAGLYGNGAGLTLKALPEGGVAAILRLPLTA
jgi:LytS/YehU family sensor histidine kinase